MPVSAYIVELKGLRSESGMAECRNSPKNLQILLEHLGGSHIDPSTKNTAVNKRGRGLALHQELENKIK